MSRSFTTLRSRTERPVARRIMAGLMCLVVTATIVHADPRPAVAGPSGDRPRVPADVKPAPARPAPRGLTKLPDNARDLAAKAAPSYSWPAAGTKEVTIAGGGTGVRAAKAAGAKAPIRVKVQTYAKEVATRAKSNGPVMRLSPGTGAKAGTARMSFDYRKFAGGTSGDLGGRLTLVTLPECALTTPDAPACAPRRLAVVNNAPAKTLTATVNVAAAGTLVAMQSSAGSAKGNYGATPLAPSSTWSVSPSSGSFSWSYPVRVPPVPGGFGPNISFAYNSQSVDGQTGATNNQGSWIGEGFGYEPGYVERRYKPCADDGHKTVGDLCWAYDNAVLSLNGASSELIRSGSTWKLANDDGSKIERLTSTTNGNGAQNGEHWKLTTTDGTQYFFGLNRLPGWATGKEETGSTWTVPVYGDDAANNDDKLPGATTAPAEPCYNATFANAWCQQAWRWNLDYALDVHNNVITYYYGKETNYYARATKTDVNGTAYTRGGWLKRIDYGQRAGAVYTTPASAHVLFKEAERCDPTVNATACTAGSLTEATRDTWPDVPFDRLCAANVKCKTDQVSPTFFTRKRLSTVTTEIRTGDTSYGPVDRYTLDQLFPDNGDGSRGLWLHAIQQEGLYGGGDPLASPSVRLDVKQLPNRILQPNDMLGQFVRPRLGTIYNDTGGQTDIEYSKPQCGTGDVPKEGESTRLCFPVRWHGAGSEEPVTDWFNKYVVRSVQETDTTDVDPAAEIPPDMVTYYDYLGDAAWRYPDPDGMTEAKYKTWSEWRGYRTVQVSKGDSRGIKSRTEHTYLQGMHGDKNPAGGTRSVTVTDSTGTSHTDDKDFLGFEIETKVLDGTTTKVISKSTTSPVKFETASQTRTFGTDKATIIRPETQRGFTALKSGEWRETKTVTSYDATYGRATAVDDLGDVDTTTDDRCTRTYYADNDAKNIRSTAYRTETVLVKCTDTPNRATQVLSDSRIYYDNLALGAAPTRGLVTKTERLVSHNGTKATYAKVADNTFDAYGRPLTTNDVKNTTTRFAYYETFGLTAKKEEYSPKVSVDNATPVEFKHTVEYVPAWGLPTAELDWNNKRTQMTYDKLGRLTAVWMPDRNPRTLPTTRYSYVLNPGKPTVVVAEKPDPDPAETQLEYRIFDGFMRPRQVQAPGPDGGRLVTDTWYTSTGKVDRISEPYYASGAPSGQLLPTEDVNTDIQTGYAYDGADRITDVIAYSAGKEQHRTRTIYDGDRTHVVPPTGGVATTTITDARGRTSEIWYYKNRTPGADGRPAGAHDTTKYTYTPAGLLSTVTNQAGVTWKYEYDQLGRKTLADDPDAGKTTFGYDEADRLIRTTSARDETIETEYDVLGRVTGTFKVAGDSKVQLTKSVYDTRAKGQLFESTRYVDGQEYTTLNTILDNLYRPTEVKYVIPENAGENLAGVYTFTTSYNFDGTVSGTGLPASKAMPAESISYQYDGLKRLVGVNGTNNSYVTDIKYTHAGLVTQAQLDTGGRKAWVTLGYETSTKRLQTLMLKRESYTTPQNPTPDRPSSDVNQRYTYDDAGNVLSVADTPGSGDRDVQCFSYDYLGRMTDAYATGGQDCTDETVGGVAPYHASYTYDEAGNRLTEKVAAVGGAAGTERTYDYPDPTGAQPHGVQKITEKDTAGNTKLYEYKYDKTGNTEKRTEAGEDQALEWDIEGHLASVTNADGKKTSFLYGADGSRLLRREPTATTLYLPGMELRLDTTSNMVEDTRFIGLAAGAVAVRTAKGIQFQVADPNGTGQAAIDATTGAITMRRSTPFGADRGTPPAAGQWSGEKGFVGGTKDSTTGLTHLGAREYDPETGRFISVDPVMDVTNPLQMNAYAYGYDNPLSNPDPSGMKPCWDAFDCRGSQYTPPPPSKNDTDDSDPDEVKNAKEENERVKTELVNVAKALGKILMDELGITDAVDCFTKGDIGGCVSTAITVVMSLVGGAAGKLIGRYLFKWKRAAQVVESLWNLGGKLKTLVGDFFKSREALQKAESAAKTLVDKVDDVGEASAGCAGNLMHSFAPGTRVLLSDGTTRRIEDVAVGDKVVTTDPESGERKPEEVVATFINTDSDLTALTTVDEDGSISVLNTTQHHPFWSVIDNAWVDAGQLEAGDLLTMPTGDTVTVSQVDNYTGRHTMHDLTVDDVHTYYVVAGETPVLVHNVNRAGCEFSDSVKREAVDDNLVRNGGELHCDYCDQPIQIASRSRRGVTPPTNDLAYDHFNPVKRGGRGDRRNIVTACRECNGQKSDMRGPEWLARLANIHADVGSGLRDARYLNLIALG